MIDFNIENAPYSMAHRTEFVNENEICHQAYAWHILSGEDLGVNMSFVSEDREDDMYNSVYDNFNDRDWIAVTAIVA